MSERYLTAARALAFCASIISTSLLLRLGGTSLSNAASHVPLRPPTWVFLVVWPILYVTTGAAWALAGAGGDLLLGCVTLLCCIWLIIYAKLRLVTSAAFVLAAVPVLVLVASVLIRGIAGALLLPLVAWTAFAALLNAYEAIFQR